MKNPDPLLKLSTHTGVVRTLDDWSTMFHLVLVILPDRPEAAEWVPVGDRIFQVLGDADCRTAFVVPSTPAIAERILGTDERINMTFVDPDKELVGSLGITHLPAFVHLRQDTTVAAGCEGWDPSAWQQVANEIGKAMSWSVPELATLRQPARTDGYPVETA